jgi:hypothetical protein
MAAGISHRKSCQQVFIGGVKLLAFASIVFILICCLLLWFVSGFLCENEVFQEIYSPNGVHKAVVFQRNCGATTDYSTQISILAADKLPHNTGNIFIIKGAPDWTRVQVEWLDDRSILVTHADSYRTFKAETWYWFFTIDYDPVSTE